jgi:glycogen operon protein
MEWSRPDGGQMASEDWESQWARAITVALGPEFVLMVNGWWEPLEFRVPAAPASGLSWATIVDTAAGADLPGSLAAPGSINLAGRSLVLLQRQH